MSKAKPRPRVSRWRGYCLAGPQPQAIPVRENRAVINQVRLRHRLPLLVDTVTDVLRVACAASGGDVTLQEPSRLRSFSRAERRVLLAALEAVVTANPAKLGDVAGYREPWKRLGERLHPHEYPHWAHAQDVFAVARRAKVVRSLAGRVEAALGAGDVRGAAWLLRAAPGVLFRSVDRLARAAAAHDQDAVVAAVRRAAGEVSGRVLLSVREHLQNRTVRTDVSRVFANRRGRAWVTGDHRPPLDPGVLQELCAVLDAELGHRAAALDHLVVDPAVLSVALPLSGKALPGGLGVMPRGSVAPADGEVLRFFIYWKQRARRTDYDLSALLLDADYTSPQWLSYTNLRHAGGVHSGDIVEAPAGATEFIDLDLRRVGARFIIPQVNVYAGERFDEAEESFFGFMLRDQAQAGAPYEPRTMRMKSDLRGAGRVALPVVFMRGDDGRWRAKWLHLYLKGHAAFNRVEGNRVTTALLVRSIVERDYLRTGYLVDLMRAKAQAVTTYTGGPLPAGPVTFIGLEQPEDLPEGSRAITLARLSELIPA